MRVLDLIKENESEIKDRYGVRKIGVFGSYARGEEKESSDIDILVEFDEPTLHNFMGLVFYLEELFVKEVHLVTNNALSPYMRSNVEKEVVWCE
mgnify:CR=1 FL=1|jgi:predicted nucleotidyltransferase